MGGYNPQGPGGGGRGQPGGSPTPQRRSDGPKYPGIIPAKRVQRPQGVQNYIPGSYTDRAKAILDEAAGPVTGAELARLLGCSESYGQRLLRKLSAAGNGHVGNGAAP
jgi:hypothetical protein